MLMLSWLIGSRIGRLKERTCVIVPVMPGPWWRRWGR
jgi:hypothetical protein